MTYKAFISYSHAADGQLAPGDPVRSAIVRQTLVQAALYSRFSGQDDARNDTKSCGLQSRQRSTRLNTSYCLPP